MLGGIMEVKKIKSILLSMILILIIFWGFTYYENSTISKVFRDQNILTSMNFADGKVVLIKNGENIQAKYMKKGFLGWYTKLSSAPIIAKYSNDIYSINYIEHFSIDGHTLLFGYIMNNDIVEVRFHTKQSEDFFHNYDIRYKVKSSYWLIPINSEIGGFNADQLSIVLKDGSENFYPFQ